MPTSTNVTNLKINELTEAQFDSAVSGGVIGANEISILTDVDEAIQVDTMPTAGADELGKVYQFIGTTDANYTHGYFYECVSDGQNPATYSWSNIQVQAGGSSYTAGTGIDITSGVISVTTPTLTNVATGSGSIMVGSTSELGRTGSVVIGDGANNASFAADTVLIGKSATGSTGSVAIGRNTQNSSPYNIAIGYYAKTTGQHAIQLNCSGSTVTNSDANTFKIANGNGNYEMMSADGTIPTDRFTTTPSADGTYVPTLTISSGVATRTWTAPGGGGSTAATGTLVAANWSSSSQTINVTGVTASNNVIVAPAPASQAAYTSAGIICTAQGAGTLTFTCTSTPASDLTVNVLII